MNQVIARDQLRSIVQRVERLSEEAKSINEDKAEVYKEAKANGFNVKVLKRIVQRRTKDADDVAEEDAMFDLYMAAINGNDDSGTVSATRASTRPQIAKPAAPVKAAAEDREPIAQSTPASQEAGDAQAKAGMAVGSRRDPWMMDEPVPEYLRRVG